jgi:hypothetical protein
MLRRALRIRETRYFYRHQKHILEQLTQDEDIGRVRQIRTGEQVKTIYDVATSPESKYAIQKTRGGETRTVAGNEMNETEGEKSPYRWYNEADAVEDEVLFSGRRDQGLFKPATIPMAIMERSRTTEPMLKKDGASLIRGVGMDEMKYYKVQKAKTVMSTGDGGEARHFIHSVPPIWRHAYFEINRNIGKHGRDREDMLGRLKFFSQRLETSGRELQELSQLELVKRETANGMCPTLDYLLDADPRS